MAGKKAINYIEENKNFLIDVSDKIWEYAEVGLQEEKSAKLLADILEEKGFEVNRGVAGMPTAFEAKWGSGEPKIGFLAEYDALPHLSQKVETEKDPLKEDAPGHGCGHNLYGAGVLGAVLSLQEEMKADNLEGTIIFYGCPAEETLVGKVFMAKEGLFDNLDAVLTWHPMSLNTGWAGSSNAMNSVKFNFHGRTAHAAGDPHNGRSALDGVELMNVGVNYLREHVISSARMHYVITNGGGEPNVVPDKAQVWYYVRAPKRNDVDEIFERVVKIAKGAALMTETTMDYKILAACYNYLPNDTISDVMLESMKEIGPYEWTDEEQKFAKEISKTYEDMRKRAVEDLDDAKTYEDKYIHDDVVEPKDKGETMAGSTDVSDVSWIAPTGQIVTACSGIGSPGHSWQKVAFYGMSIGHKGMLLAAKTMALSGSKLLRDKKVLEKAKEEFKIKTKGQKYQSPLPEDAKPPFDQMDKHQ